MRYKYLIGLAEGGLMESPPRRTTTPRVIVARSVEEAYEIWGRETGEDPDGYFKATCEATTDPRIDVVPWDDRLKVWLRLVKETLTTE